MSPLFDDRGFPHPQDEWENMLPEVKAGRLIRKRLHDPPKLQDVDPAFGVEFDEKLHGKMLKEELDIAHLTTFQQSVLTAVIKKYWRVFCKEGVTTPVKDYECEIDTGDASPIRCKNPRFGPLETPLIEKAIAKLMELGHVGQIHDGQWLSKPLLAAKPHQENVTDIANFVWRFCVNYIALNSVTKIIAMPIPRCDEAVTMDFGGSRWKWLMDAISGYNQIRVAKSSRVKLAFAGPNCTKYTYYVMPFGPVNGPVIFIIFIHDMDATWKDLARTKGIVFDVRTGTRIIVDDIFSWAPTFEDFIKYLECQLEVCLSQNLSLSLKKCLFCPVRMEFVGHDVCQDGNRPAQSKHGLVKTWPKFKEARDVSSFLGFANFYSAYIPYFEQRAGPLRKLAMMDAEVDITNLMTEDCVNARADLIEAILSDPCIARFDFQKRPYLLTDFCKLGFGFNLCQPNDDAESLAAMNREMEGGDCEFLTPKSKLLLRTTGFGSRRSRGRESSLHSHLGEGFALDWGINKCRAKLWGVKFTAITDCYALRFILSYDGPNAVILRLQMRLMLWAMDLYHRNAKYLITPDYLSRLGADLYFDEMSRLYLSKTIDLRRAHAPVTGQMKKENMPGYRAPRIRSGFPIPGKDESPPTSIDHKISSLLASINMRDSGGHEFGLQVVPILTGNIVSHKGNRARHVPLHNHDLAVMAADFVKVSFAVYGFNSGHFTSCFSSGPLDIVLAADTRPSARAMFKKFAKCPRICESADGLLHCISASKAKSVIQGYIIHTHRFLKHETEKKFWSVQVAIVKALREHRSLMVLMAFIHPSCDTALAKGFTRAIQRTGWIVTTVHTYYPDLGDSIADEGFFLLAMHKGASSIREKMVTKTPPTVTPMRLSYFMYKPFNKKEFCVSLARYQDGFSETGFSAQDPVSIETATRVQRAKCSYYLHRPGDDKEVIAGASVYSDHGLCPPFVASNTNVFGSTFGVEFELDSKVFVRSVATYEIASCFRLGNDLTHSLAHPENFCLLDCGIPAKTSKCYIEVLLLRIAEMQRENFQIMQPNPCAAPAATACIPAFVNGAVGSKIPDNRTWEQALQEDPVTKLLLEIAANPSLGESQAHVQPLDHIYRQPARHGNFSTRDGVLYMKEIFQDDDRFVELRIVPSSMRNIIFVAFHANPIGGHLNSFRTYHRIRQRYFWPGMFQYIQKMCRACPGCNLSNITRNRCADLVYSFPIEAPMRVLFVDIYAAGAEFNFEGTKHYLIAACGMTAFAIAEDTAEQNSKAFASALMKIWLRFGFSHTIVVDKDSKFLGVFVQTAALLKINIHVLSGENHDPMLVERICRYLNSCLTVFCNERGDNRVALEGILMSLYGWNSAPAIGTDISRSLLVTGREFNFPIDFSTEQHLMLTSSARKVSNYAADQAGLLSCGRLIAKELIHAHRSWHREYINSKRPDPRLYSIGDHVFAKRAVKSDKKRGLVGKLMDAYTGPWIVTAKLKGSSYEIKHRDSGTMSKRHAAHLSPYPDELLPFLPVDGPDNQYGQIHMPMKKSPYQNAGLKGFEPHNPYKVAAHAVTHSDDNDIKFPTLAELNAECFEFEEGEEDLLLADDSLCQMVEIFAVTRSQSTANKRGPPPPVQAPPAPKVPLIGPLVANILASKDKLFFISHKIPGSEISEWALVRIDLQLSVKAHPAAVQDGRFLAQFYTCHPADKRYNAINQRYWLEYHPRYELASPARNKHTHLIRPSADSARYAIAEGLQPFSLWIRLTNHDTYISGPFDFADVNGRRTRDRVPEAQWRLLSKYPGLANEVPSLDLPSYSVHYGQFHTVFFDKSVEAKLEAYFTSPSTPNTV